MRAGCLSVDSSVEKTDSGEELDEGDPAHPVGGGERGRSFQYRSFVNIVPSGPFAHSHPLQSAHTIPASAACHRVSTVAPHASQVAPSGEKS